MSSITGSRHNCEQGQPKPQLGGGAQPATTTGREGHHHKPHPTGGAGGDTMGWGGRRGVAALHHDMYNKKQKHAHIPNTCTLIPTGRVGPVGPRLARGPQRGGGGGGVQVHGWPLNHGLTGLCVGRALGAHARHAKAGSPRSPLLDLELLPLLLRSVLLSFCS